MYIYMYIYIITCFEYLDICLATLMNLLDIFSIDGEPIVDIDDDVSIIFIIIIIDRVSMIITIVDIDDDAGMISPSS